MADRDLTGRTLGEFVLREEIGTGGYGVVYRSEQPSLQRSVVVKVLHERRQRSDRSRQRFLREAQLASKLDHPFAAHIYSFGEAPGETDEDRLLWIAMELVQGITLGAWLAAHGPMPPEQFVPFFEGVADVVQEAHERGIVHRDLKPSNIMVIERAGGLVPKLVDFGIAKIDSEMVAATLPNWPEGSLAENHETDAERPHGGAGSSAHGPRPTGSDASFGSLEYMSPEQWTEPGGVGPSADIYSLGVVAFQTLTGRVPFKADSSEAYYRKHRYDPVPSLGDHFPPDLYRVIQRALAKYPQARYGNAKQLAAELRAALRVSDRDQLRTSAEQWAARARPSGLLWGREVIEDVMRRVPLERMSDLECSFVAAGHRRARRIVWALRSFVGIVAVVAFCVFQYRSRMETRLAQEQTRAAQQLTRAAQEFAEATVTQSELEQGRSALLHGEPEAPLHLRRAYERGERSPGAVFMFARALQPKLAERARFASSGGRMWSAAFSPSGHQIVTTDDRGAAVWDGQSYGPLFSLPHGSEVYHAIYSANGTRLVTAGQDAVRLWDTVSGDLVRKFIARPNDLKPSDYYLAAISLDGSLVSAIDAAGSVVHVWDARTGAQLAELHNGDATDFPGVAFSSDGRWLATTGGNAVRVFDTRTWRLALTIRGPRIHRFAFDPTASRLVTGSATGDVTIWEIPSGARIRHLREIGEAADAVAFSPDGQLVAAGSRDGAAQIWRTASGELQNQFNSRHARILAIEFDRTSKLVLTAIADGTVVVADAAQGMPVTVLEGPKSAVRVAHFDPTSRRVVGASRDGTARVWDATSSYRRWNSAPIADDCALSTSPQADGRFIAIGCSDNTTHVWDTARDELLATLPAVSRVPGDFTSASPVVSATGDRAAVARGSEVQVYELPGGRLLRTIAHEAPVNAVAYATFGRDLVSGSVDGAVLVARDSGAMVRLPSSAAGIDALAFLEDGRVVASDARRRLRVYDPQQGALLAEFELASRAASLRVDGVRLATVPMVPKYAAVAPPQLVDLERYRVVARLEGHVGQVFSVRWVAGNQIITAGSDGTAKSWDGATGQLRQTYQGGSRFLADATVASENLVIAGGADGHLKFWDRASGRLLWSLPAHKSQLLGVHMEGADIVTRGFTGELFRWTLPDPERVIGVCGSQDRCGIVAR